MGDKRPSQFLRLQCLSGTTVPEPLISSLWSRRLPSAIRPIMAMMAGRPLQTAADIVDKVYTILPSSIAETTSSKNGMSPN